MDHWHWYASGELVGLRVNQLYFLAWVRFSILVGLQSLNGFAAMADRHIRFMAANVLVAVRY